MPNATELRAEAASLDEVVETLRAIGAGVRGDRHDLGVRGGAAVLVTGAIDASASDLDDLGRHVSALVDELQRRAALCDQYTADLRRYEDHHRRWTAAVHRWRTDTDLERPWPGPEPVPPAPPFPGAVAG